MRAGPVGRPVIAVTRPAKMAAIDGRPQLCFIIIMRSLLASMISHVLRRQRLALATKTYYFSHSCIVIVDFNSDTISSMMHVDSANLHQHMSSVCVMGRMHHTTSNQRFADSWPNTQLPTYRRVVLTRSTTHRFSMPFHQFPLMTA